MTELAQKLQTWPGFKETVALEYQDRPRDVRWHAGTLRIRALHLQMLTMTATVTVHNMQMKALLGAGDAASGAAR